MIGAWRQAVVELSSVDKNQWFSAVLYSLEPCNFDAIAFNHRHRRAILIVFLFFRLEKRCIRFHNTFITEDVLMAKAPTKTQVLNGLAERSGLNKKDVAAVLDALACYIGETISDGETPFTIPGLCKVVPQIKPATPARYGVPNPFQPGQTMDVSAKPERKVVKVRPLKGLKDMVAGSAPAAEAAPAPAAEAAPAPAAEEEAPAADDGGGDGGDGGGETSSSW